MRRYPRTSWPACMHTIKRDYKPIVKPIPTCIFTQINTEKLS